MKSDLIDLTMVLHAETARAVRVSDTGEDARAVWLPKSQVEIILATSPRTALDGDVASGVRDAAGLKAVKTVTAEGRGRQLSRLPVVTVTLPEWLAIDKGLA